VAGPLTQPAADLRPAEPAPGAGTRQPLPAPAGAPAAGGRRPPDLADPRQVAALQGAAGNRAVGRAIERSRGALRSAARRLARMGYRLNVPLPSTAPRPLEDHYPTQRKWAKTDFYKFWEAEQGRTLNATEKTTIDRGCIGITANNLNGGGNPSLVEVYDNFLSAQEAARRHNVGLRPSDNRYVIFGMLFWSNQNPDASKRLNPIPGAFKGDRTTHKVDMTGYAYRAQPGKVNFDYGFWDPSVQSFWHANHMEMGPADPMKVYQSTRDKFAHHFTMPDGSDRYGYVDFDRAIYGVAVANNYDPKKGKALR